MERFGPSLLLAWEKITHLPGSGVYFKLKLFAFSGISAECRHLLKISWINSVCQDVGPRAVVKRIAFRFSFIFVTKSLKQYVLRPSCEKRFLTILYVFVQKKTLFPFLYLVICLCYNVQTS